jgi:hypothetical protein
MHHTDANLSAFCLAEMVCAVGWVGDSFDAARANLTGSDSAVSRCFSITET